MLHPHGCPQGRNIHNYKAFYRWIIWIHIFTRLLIGGWFTCMYTAIYDYIWLHMATYGYIWLLYRCIWLDMAVRWGWGCGCGPAGPPGDLLARSRRDLARRSRFCGEVATFSARRGLIWRDHGVISPHKVPPLSVAATRVGRILLEASFRILKHFSLWKSTENNDVKWRKTT